MRKMCENEKRRQALLLADKKLALRLEELADGLRELKRDRLLARVVAYNLRCQHEVAEKELHELQDLCERVCKGLQVRCVGLCCVFPHRDWVSWGCGPYVHALLVETLTAFAKFPFLVLQEIQRSRQARPASTFGCKRGSDSEGPRCALC